MPTTRRRRTRQPITAGTGWVVRYLLTDEEPPEGTPDHDAFLGWRFFGERVPGLPPSLTEADAAELQRLKAKVRRQAKRHP
jgi:hypothetical protein